MNLKNHAAVSLPFRYLPEPYELKPFQIEAVQKMLEFLSLRNGVYNAAEMGCGKSVMACAVCNVLNPAKILVLCPAVMRFVWRNEFKRFLLSPRKTLVIQTGKDLQHLYGAACELVICSYDLAAKEETAKRLAGKRFDILIADEAHYCIDIHTKIWTENGLKELKDVQIGERVWSSYSNGVRLNRVIRKFERQGDEYYTVRNGAQTIDCLGEHRFLNENHRWQSVKTMEVSTKVRVLPGSFWSAIPLAPRSKVLRPKMRKAQPLLQRGVGSAYAQAQSHAQSREPQENARNSPTYQAPTKNPRWQRAACTQSSSKADGNFSISFPRADDSNRVCGSNTAELENQLSQSLQNRLCNSSFKNSSRSRWAIAPSDSANEERPEKRCQTSPARLARVSISKRNNSKQSFKSFGDLEVERDHNYIANGFIVHNCKNRKTLRSKSLFKIIKPSVQKTIALSGTPITDCIADLYTWAHSFMPVQFPSFYPFVNRYAEQQMTPFGVKYYGFRNENELNGIIRKNFFLRYLKKDVLPELPDKVWSEVPLPESYAVKKLPLPPECKITLEQALLAAESALETGVRLNLETEHVVKSIRHAQGIAKAPAVAEFAANMLEQDIPVVIFAMHTAVIEALREALKDYSPVVIQGSTSAKDRENAVAVFQAGGTNCFIGQFVAAGTGITLTRSSNVVLAELDYSPATISQAVDRCHRIGQKDNVNIYYFVVDESIENRIVSVLVQKTKSFEKLGASKENSKALHESVR